VERPEVTRKVTIKTIADDLGISHMTVSRALSGHANVRAETRDAVLLRARELGYVKSAAASAMRGDKTSIIGMLLPNISNEFYARFANDVSIRCSQRGLSPLIHLTNDEPQAEADGLRRLQELQASAVIMVPAPRSSDDDTNLGDMRVVQLIRRRPEARPTSAVVIDDALAIQDAVLRLAASGKSRIAYVGASGFLSSGRARLAAFRAGLSAAHLPEHPDLIQTGPASFDMGHDAIARLLSTEPPDALICGGLEISNGALVGLLEHNLSLPEELAFVGYGDPSFYRWISGGVTTISLPVSGIAEDAVALVADESPTPQTRSRAAGLKLRSTA
jgi:DNA-binding LacI/PurR family transcriptional regulator